MCKPPSGGRIARFCRSRRLEGQAPTRPNTRSWAAATPLPGRVGVCDARGVMTPAVDIDWSAAAWRLELAVEAWSVTVS